MVSKKNELQTGKKTENKAIINKSKAKPFLIRAPENYVKDLKEIASLTGLSVNAVCLEILRVGIKEKFKELKD